MKKITEFKNFETFIKEMNENHTQKKSVVDTIVKEIKEKYGQTAKEFISTVNKKGVDDLKDFIKQTVKPIDSIETKTLIADYDSVFRVWLLGLCLKCNLKKINSREIPHIFFKFLNIFSWTLT